MKSKQVLDVQQMQHLQEMGLNTSNASAEYYRMSKKMDWFLVFGCRSKEELLDTEENISAYTLQDVLDALPIEIKYKDKRCWLCIELADEMIGYYYENARFEHRWVYYEVVMIDESLIDAAYSLLCWAIDNKFVETNKNE